jgi:raffinose/stachyose/melibiose transport system substrate-binding protein
LRLISLLLCLFALATAHAVHAGTLVIESWRADDKLLWETVLIPAFNKKYPTIEIKFLPTAPTDYDAALLSRLKNGRAGDLIACRPFDASLSLFRQGFLDKLDNKPGMENFPASALLAWQSEDEKSTFCMPIASVIHGFLYNKRIFKKLNLQIPRTDAELIAVLDAVKMNRTYVPLALGTADQWEATQTVLTSIGPNFWHGEAGRKALISGKAKFTDKEFLSALEYEAKLGSYLSSTASTQTYSDSQHLFALGQAAIYPMGSWDISYFNQVPGLEFGVFAPPVSKLGEPCYILDHMDIGIGINRKSKNKEDALQFLEWIGSQEFADIYTNRATGFFSLSNHLIAVRDPISRQMMEWRSSCESTIRIDAQILNSAQAKWQKELWKVNAQVLNGTIRPRDAALKIHNAYLTWFKPRVQ